MRRCRALSASYRQLKYDVGDLTAAHGARKHTRLEITQYQIGDVPPDVVLSILGYYWVAD